MAILFGCPECGKQLRLGEASAGKTCKCPGCGTLIQVPEADAVEAEVDAVEAEMEAPAEAAASIGAVVAPSEASAGEDRPDTVQTSASDDDLRSAERRARRRRRRTSSSAVVWVVLSGMLVLLLAGGGVAVYFLIFHRTSISEELAVLPNEYDFVESVNVEAVLASELYASEQQDGTLFASDELVKPFLEMGFEPDSLHRVTRGGKVGDYVTVVRPKQPMTGDEVRARLAENKWPYRKQGDGETVYFVAEGMPRHRELGNSFAVKGPLIVFGSELTLRNILKRKEAPAPAGIMVDALREADFSAGYVRAGVNVNLVDVEDEKKDNSVVRPEFTVVAARYGKDAVELVVSEYFKDEADAAKRTEQGQAQLQKALEDPKLPEAGKAMLAKIRYRHSGRVVTSDANLTTKEYHLIRRFQ